MTKEAIALAAGIVAIPLGILIVIGARRRWSLLVTPPYQVLGLPIVPYWFLRGKRFNEEFFVVYHTVAGILMSLVGLIIAIAALLRW